MVDNANNWIGTFGRYGNTDDGRSSAPASDAVKLSTQHSVLSTSSIPLAWPTYVAVGDDCAFVNDTVSCRVVKVKLGAAAEEICEVK